MSTGPQPFIQSITLSNGFVFHFNHSSQENDKNQLAFPELNLNNPSNKFTLHDLFDHQNQPSSPIADISDSFFEFFGDSQDFQISSPSYLSPLEEGVYEQRQQHDYDDMIKDFLLSGVSENSKTILKKTYSSNSNQSSASKQSSQTKKRQTWKPEEDVLVMQLIEKHGHRWNEISKLMNNRSGKQIRDRYLNVLMPNINKSSWTQQEDEVIMSTYQQHGAKWRHIAKELKGRTESQVKNRFHTYLKGIYSKRLSAKNIKASQSPISNLDVYGSPSTCLESPHSYNSFEVNGKKTDFVDMMFSFNN